jgi:hypothetical protein
LASVSLRITKEILAMERPAGTAATDRRPRPFTFLAVTLLLLAIVGLLVEKQYESRAMMLMARTMAAGGHMEDSRAERERLDRNATWWQMLNLASAGLAIAAWGFALVCREPHRRLLIFAVVLVYGFLWFMMV